MMKERLNKNVVPNALDLFFYPRSIAMIGASQNPLKPNGIPLYLLSMFNYQGETYPVNPKYDRVGGLKCYASVLDIPATPDLAIIGVAADRVLPVLGECAQKKVPAVIIFTSGFAETGKEGRLAQEEIKKLARDAGMRILGPNCLGTMNYYNGCVASFFYNQKEDNLAYPRHLSFITQSGGLGGIIYQMISQLSLGFNYFVSTGNEVDVSFGEMMHYLAGREEVKVIGGYLEGLQADGDLFVEGCRRALAQGKLVTLLKVGKTSGGAAAAASHTGALVGEDRVYDGIFRQYAVQRADDVEQMNALVALHAAGRYPAGKRIAVITISGGGGVVVADKCPLYGLEVVGLTEETQAALREFFPVYGAVGNPVDLTAQLFTDTALFQRALRLVMDDPNVDVGGFFYNLEMPDPEAADKIIRLYHETAKPLVVFTWPTGEEYALAARKKLVRAGVPVIEHIPSGLWALAALTEWACRKEYYRPPAPAGVIRGAREEAEKIFQARCLLPGEYLEERYAKQILAAYGIPVTREKLACTPEEAARFAAEIGFPVAMKISSASLPHKSDSGGVELHLENELQARQAFAGIMDRVRQAAPGAVTDGVLVSEMLPPGLEVIVGIKKDRLFGPLVMLGLGGVFVEVFADTAVRAAPIDEAEAAAMIDQLRGRALFAEVRRRLPRDREALGKVLVRLSLLAMELEEHINELDINPLIVFGEGEGVKAADALIVGGRSNNNK